MFQVNDQVKYADGSDDRVWIVQAVYGSGPSSTYDIALADDTGQTRQGVPYGGLKIAD